MFFGGQNRRDKDYVYKADLYDLEESNHKEPTF